MEFLTVVVSLLFVASEVVFVNDMLDFLHVKLIKCMETKKLESKMFIHSVLNIYAW